MTIVVEIYQPASIIAKNESKIQIFELPKSQKKNLKNQKDSMPRNYLKYIYIYIYDYITGNI